MPTSPTESDDPLTIPRPRDQQRPAPFPLAASIAPLLASGVLWAVTQSVFALVFALLSPVVAVAGMLDARRHARRRRRDEEERYARELASARRLLGERHDAERAERIDRAPGAVAALDADRVGRWNGDPARFAVVSLGRGTVASTVRVSGAGADDESGLRADAVALADAPVEADAALGIGVTGPPALARAVARGYVIQLADAFAPDRMVLRLAGAVAPSPADRGWGWVRALPHLRDDDADFVLEIRDDAAPAPGGAGTDGEPGGARPPARPRLESGAEPVAAAADRDNGARSPNVRRAMIAVARTPQELPAGCRVVVAVDGPTRARVITGPSGCPRDPFAPESVPQSAAAAFATTSNERARAAGLSSTAALLPRRVLFDDLEQPDAPGLSCTIGSGSAGPFTVDLVASGPHAVVVGTTGSGKSELLVTWATAMAARRRPDEVAFLLVDFKGGTAFAPLTRLPHTVGVITDLAHGEALRALQSLQAELRRRERLLAETGARDIDEAGGTIGRLVIMVDEFAAMLDAFPELNPVFTDVAARGRALGIHLVLCTQRATGVVRDALLANCALRISLRVTGGADSAAVLGTNAAAQLPPATPGRCIVAHDGQYSMVQAAVTGLPQIEQVARIAEGAGDTRPMRPWQDPLPAMVPVADLAELSGEDASDPAWLPRGVLAIGLCDRPDEQRRHVVPYDPSVEHLFALGMRGSGKSTLVRSVASRWPGRTIVVPHDGEGVWDAIEAAHRLLRNGVGVGAGAGAVAADGVGTVPSTVVLIDDLDAVLERFDGEYRDLLGERLLALLRDGPQAGLSVVCTASRLTQAVRPLLSLLSATIVLAQVNRQEHLLAGAPAHLFEDRARPGLGVWQGHRIQLAYPDEGGSDAGTPTIDAGRVHDGQEPRGATTLAFEPGSTTIVVSRAPGRVAGELQRTQGERIRVLDVSSPLADAGSGDGAMLTIDSPPFQLPSVESASVASHDGASHGGASRDGASRDGAEPPGDGGALVMIGDPDAWLARWPLFARVRARGTVVFDGCSVADVRALLRSRVLPPPLANVDGRVWVTDDAGGLTRATLW